MAADYLLEIDGIKGESTQTNYEGTIEILSFSWGISNTGAAAMGTGMGSSKANIHDFSFMIYAGISSPKLMLACATGKHIPKAILHCRKAGGGEEGGEEYYTWEFTDVFISSYQVSGGGEVPTESCSFNCTKVEQVYKPQAQEGTTSDNIRASYDVKTGKSA